jgi:hypothetical protein
MMLLLPLIASATCRRLISLCCMLGLFELGQGIPQLGSRFAELRSPIGKKGLSALDVFSLEQRPLISSPRATWRLRSRAALISSSSEAREVMLLTTSRAKTLRIRSSFPQLKSH